jgi:dynein light chain 1|tara:strand:- start:1007 stop:1372 length:366 start_codon:yes stop_codon:yes gene_type:complete
LLLSRVRSSWTSCKDAIKHWEAAEGKVAAEAEDVRLCPIAMQMPLIQKMDGSLQQLKKCKHLRLSTNSIDKISNLHGLDCLEILSVGRNQATKTQLQSDWSCSPTALQSDWSCRPTELQTD